MKCFTPVARASNIVSASQLFRSAIAARTRPAAFMAPRQFEYFVAIARHGSFSAAALDNRYRAAGREQADRSDWQKDGIQRARPGGEDIMWESALVAVDSPAGAATLSTLAPLIQSLTRELVESGRWPGETVASAPRDPAHA